MACEQKQVPSSDSFSADSHTVSIDRSVLKIFGEPLPKRFESASNPTTDAKVALGRSLYYEKRLSRPQTIACNTCHLLDKYGVDGDPTSTGFKGQKGGRNAPTVYHAAGHIAQFWDGRAKDVEEQAKGPILNPIEMAMPDAASVIALLNTIPGYVEDFKKAFPDSEDPVTYDNLGLAIGAFERGLVTPSPFDAYLRGDEKAINAGQKAGLKMFIETGCITCHAGTNLGGHMYQKLGLVKPWPDLEDEGRAEVTRNEAEKYFFKVPSLRNIVKTGPYLHDGSVSDLNLLVTMMAKHQLGKELIGEQVTSIVEFLGSLTGELPTEYIKAPEPHSGTDKTPKPDAG